MKTASRNQGTKLVLQARTAADLMTSNPVSIRADAPVMEAVTLFVDKGISAAPVIDDAGRPVGVVSQADIVVHDREKVEYASAGNHVAQPFSRDFHVETVEETSVADIMTPAVFSVAPDTPAEKVIEEMLSLKVRRLFVVGDDGVLVGVISTSDVVRHLRPATEEKE